ncbi:hypothetical protein [Enterococcus pallens]|uniref:Uncharacterized protein n=1 Tax=Enterococcus pallens ATCC BAA-351 TaxID=1158607 RepID=R2SYF5_9ENTE|nr:hypothetical protein [Enterococcus pallens]EOH93014.1 hypothetical protein UAU_02656 [Enterococcus pallens ATCC BAA-351]EOU24800.1 hypothetical protein I588_00787 [Enterococcus pallens ATCC BAA-351]
MSKKRVFEGKVLGEGMSKDWKYFLETAPTFNYSTIGEISLVCPFPNGKGSFLVREDQPYLSKESPLETIDQFFKTHRLMDYQLMRRTCQSLEALPSLKVPIVNQHFVLFPIIKPESSSWLNPLTIDDVQESGGFCMVTMSHGLCLELPISKRSLVNLAGKAVYSLATYRQDYASSLQSDGVPLDYVSLPTTPFGQLLTTQEVLQSWRMSPGKFFSQYKLEEHLHWYQQLADRPELAALLY